MKHVFHNSDAPLISEIVLHTFRLRLLKVLLLTGTVAIALIWLFEAETARLMLLDRVAYPTMIAIFSLSCALLALRPSLLGVVEQVSFTTFAGYVVLHAQPAVLVDMDTYAL